MPPEDGRSEEAKHVAEEQAGFFSARFDVRRVVGVVSVVCCLPTLLAPGARLWWMLELLTHFRVYYVLLLAPLLAVASNHRRYGLSLCLTACLLVNLAYIVPLYVSTNGDSNATSRLRVMIVNVYTKNQDRQSLIDLVRHEQPDVLLLMEVDAPWLKDLASLEIEYPHRLSRPANDNFGIALWSRLEAKAMNVRNIGPAGIPSIHAELLLDDQSVTIIGTHPLPPTGPANADLRNRQLAELGKLAGSLHGPVIVMGDLNASSWSPYFGDLLTVGRLRDSRRGFGVQPSWSGRRKWMRLPLDHVLVSETVDVLHRRVGPDIGSDHFPVIADLGIAGGS